MATDLVAVGGSQSYFPDDDSLYEVIDGAIVEVPAMGTRQTVLTNFLHVSLANQTGDLGRAVVEMLFDFTEQVGRKRRPDLAFISYGRWPRSTPIPDVDGWPVVPNLAVEVISRTNTWDEVMEKIEEYFQVGVERVWVITTSRKLIHVHESPTRVTILTTADELVGDLTLPGFRLSVSELFSSIDA